jgi:hypothetical protein
MQEAKQVGSGKYSSGPITRSFKMGFGMYAHKTVRELLDEDPKYLQWCMENLGWFSARVELGLEEQIDRYAKAAKE